MKITVKPSFGRDVDRVRSLKLLAALALKIEQILDAHTIA